MVVKPLLLAALLASVASTGCFTTIGGVVGSAVSSPRKKPAQHAPDGAQIEDDEDSNAALIGLAVGAAIDIAIVYAAMHALDGLGTGECSYGGCNGDY
jgi:hypothetical protein